MKDDKKQTDKEIKRWIVISSQLSKHFDEQI